MGSGLSMRDGWRRSGGCRVRWRLSRAGATAMILKLARLAIYLNQKTP